MSTDPNYYEIQIDDEGTPVRTVLLWIVFVVLCAAIIACAVWVFCFSKRGLNFEPTRHSSHVEQVSGPEPASSQSALPFVGVSLSHSALTLTEGESKMLAAVLKLAPGSPYVNVQTLKVRWRSENPAIVSVNRQGDLVARQPGRARISATVTDRHVDSNKAYCIVEVRPRAVRDSTASTEDSIIQPTTP